VEPLRRAFQLWQQIDAPYIAARIRVLLASAYRALADADATELELEAAREVFERTAAPPFDRDRIVRRGRRRGPATAAPTLGRRPARTVATTALVTTVRSSNP